MKGQFMIHKFVLTIALLILATVSWSVQVMNAQSASVQTTNNLFLPLINSGKIDPTATPTSTTQPSTPTATPTATTEAGVPTATPTTPATPAPPVRPAIFVDTQWKTSSASMAVDAQGGLHMAYYYYEPSGGQSPTAAVYLYCPTLCESGDNWHGVSMGEGVSEVQVALTAAGQPRMLYRTTSTVQSGGNDYHYAECNTDCTNPASWMSTRVVTSYGTSIFDISDDSLPQRYFALDPQGRPRFLYLDRNYPIEPDHYGLFYVTCEADCTDSANWSQALISAVIKEEFFFDWEVVTYPSLTFTSDGQPRFIAELMALADQNRETALYYFACDTGCDDIDNWGRVKIGERGQGSELSWDLALDADNRPRVAHYPASLPDEQGEQLYYTWCNSDCLNPANWTQTNLGLGKRSGQGPDLELDNQGRPRIAYADPNYGGLGYIWCNVDCESTQGQWEYEIIDWDAKLYAEWPIAYPVTCDAGLWNGLTPSLTLDVQGNPRIAYDTTYNARCLYDDPNDSNDVPYYRFHLVMRAVRGIFFAQP